MRIGKNGKGNSRNEDFYSEVYVVINGVENPGLRMYTFMCEDVRI